MEASSRDPGAVGKGTSLRVLLKAIPFPVALLVLTLALGLASGMDDGRLTAALNKGFGLNIGYFAVLLFSSFLLAEAISIGKGFSLGRLGPAIAPFAGAGMVCCDTAYATLTPMAGKYKRYVAAGAYSGFKLLIPAGPLLIGSSLKAETGALSFVLLGLGLAAITTLAGIACLRLADAAHPALRSDQESAIRGEGGIWRSILPFAVMIILLIAGFAFDLTAMPALKFICAPIGALVASAVAAFALVSPDRRGAACEAALKRTASLVFVIGSATSLGTMLGVMLPIDALASSFASAKGSLALCGISFAVAALFKVINGSSMATFATVPPLVAPLLAASSIDPRLATYALCLGSFVAILPNDSFFWITQPPISAKPGSKPDFSLTWVSIVQACAGLAALAGYALLA
jgi:gluconate:H+ symporter, GntP family